MGWREGGREGLYTGFDTLTRRQRAKPKPRCSFELVNESTITVSAPISFMFTFTRGDTRGW